MTVAAAARQGRVEVVSTARRLVDRGLCIGTAGNVSLRVGDDVLITPSGVGVDALTPESICVVDLDGRLISGAKPSSELAMHLLLYRVTAARAAVHTHSAFATAVGLLLDELPTIHYAMVPLGGSVRVAPYATFGTTDLATNVAEAVAGRTAVLLANHGALTFGASLAEAYDRAELLEWLCALYCRSAQLGAPKVLTDRQMRAAAEQFNLLHYGEPG